MTEYTVTKTTKAVSGLAAAALATAAFVTSAMGAAPAANATCASFFGIGNGNGCTSSFGGIAIGLGDGAFAVASGFFSTALGFGNNSAVQANGNLNFAIAAGTNALAVAGNSANNNDIGQVAMTFGDNSIAAAETPGQGGYFNIATNLGNTSTVETIGAFSNASNFGNSNTVLSIGVANSASNMGGDHNYVESYSTSKSPTFLNAFNLFGSHNVVTTQTGPFAVAATILQSNLNISQSKTGFNINGSAGSAAAPKQAAAVSKAGVKSASSTHNKSTDSAAAKHARRG